MIESLLIQSGVRNIAGVDEAGRGPCAGPLIISAVILKDLSSTLFSGVKDSKALTHIQREEPFQEIIENSLSYSIIEVTVS